ncbi:MAG: hypothetical protein ABI559_10165 [Chloroflexota bacterium]
MGTFKRRLEVAATAKGPFRGVFALVNTGAHFTWLPGRILRGLGLEPTDKQDFEMANGQIESRDITEAVVRLDGRIRTTICVFGPDNAQALLGAYTLEGFALAVDPTNKRLIHLPVVPAAATH